MKCARTVCNNEATHRIYNDPCVENGYRLYCEKCTMKIISYSVDLNEPLAYELDIPSTTAGTDEKKSRIA